MEKLFYYGLPKGLFELKKFQNFINSFAFNGYSLKTIFEFSPKEYKINYETQNSVVIRYTELKQNPDIIKIRLYGEKEKVSDIESIICFESLNKIETPILLDWKYKNVRHFYYKKCWDDELNLYLKYDPEGRDLEPEIDE
jgi:hypothetical protein